MKKFVVESRVVMLNLLVPFEVGQVKGQGVVVVHYDGNDENTGVDIADCEDISYMGMQINEGPKGYKKLKDFHSDLGIDLDKLIDDQINKVLTPEVIKEITQTNK